MTPDKDLNEAHTELFPGSEMNLHGERIKEVLQRIDALSHPEAKNLLQDCMEAVFAFYGHGLRRILHLAMKADSQKSGVYRALIEDAVIRDLLLIHDLHPLNLETRLREALDRVRPYLRSHGGNVELITLQDGVARLRLEGTCQSCSSSAVTLELAIRQAIEKACPDLLRFEVDGIESAPAAQTIQTTTPRWFVLENLSHLEEGAWTPVRVGQVRLVICKVDQTLYAYRNRCPVCNVPFDSGKLDRGILTCAQGHRYDVRLAGQCAAIPKTHLDPYPLLAENGAVKVALNQTQ